MIRKDDKIIELITDFQERLSRVRIVNEAALTLDSLYDTGSYFGSELIDEANSLIEMWLNQNTETELANNLKEDIFKVLGEHHRSEIVEGK